MHTAFEGMVSGSMSIVVLILEMPPLLPPLPQNDPCPELFNLLQLDVYPGLLNVFGQMVSYDTLTLYCIRW